MLSRHTHTHSDIEIHVALTTALAAAPLPLSAPLFLCLSLIFGLPVHIKSNFGSFLAYAGQQRGPPSHSPLFPSLSISHNPPADYSVVVSALAIFLAANLVGHKFDFMFAKQNYAYKSCTDRGTLIKRLPYAPPAPAHTEGKPLTLLIRSVRPPKSLWHK